MLSPSALCVAWFQCQGLLTISSCNSPHQPVHIQNISVFMQVVVQMEKQSHEETSVNRCVLTICDILWTATWPSYIVYYVALLQLRFNPHVLLKSHNLKVKVYIESLMFDCNLNAFLQKIETAVQGTPTGVFCFRFFFSPKNKIKFILISKGYFECLCWKHFLRCWMKPILGLRKAE